MNLASWIILGIVLAVLALAVKATFFRKKRRGGCCDTGDAHDKRDDDLDLSGLMCSSDCGSCPACKGCASARNNLQPTYKPLK